MTLRIRPASSPRNRACEGCRLQRFLRETRREPPFVRLSGASGKLDGRPGKRRQLGDGLLRGGLRRNGFGRGGGCFGFTELPIRLQCGWARRRQRFGECQGNRLLYGDTVFVGTEEHGQIGGEGAGYGGIETDEDREPGGIGENLLCGLEGVGCKPALRVEDCGSRVVPARCGRSNWWEWARPHSGSRCDSLSAASPRVRPQDAPSSSAYSVSNEKGSDSA